jgi:hypothetical protein
MRPDMVSYSYFPPLLTCFCSFEVHSYAHHTMLERRKYFIMFARLECLFLRRELCIAFLGNFEALLLPIVRPCPSLIREFVGFTYLGRVQNGLDLLEQAALVLLEHRVGLHGLLDQKLNVPKLAEVEVALALQSLYRLQKLRVLCL